MPEKSAKVMVSRVYLSDGYIGPRLSTNCAFSPSNRFASEVHFSGTQEADARQITIEESQRCRFMSFAAGCFG